MFSSGKTRVVLITAVLTGIIAGVALYLCQGIYYVNHFPPGVYIGPVAVGGEPPEDARRALASWAREVGNTSVVFVYGNFKYQTTLKQLGGSIEPDEVVNGVLNKLNRETPWWKRSLPPPRRPEKVGYPVPVTYDNRRLIRILETLRPKVELPPRNCRVSVGSNGRLVVTPEENGRKINMKATLAAIPKFLDEGGMVIPIAVEEVKPELRQADFNDVVELASYSTHYNTGNVDRSYNLVTAARALNGTIVPPGQEFSFNAVVGPRERRTGYREALVILENQFAPGVGGGVCQVVSTLYDACLLSGLDITERHNHSVAINYVPVGLDATVNYGVKDFRFRNNSGGPVYLRSVAGRGSLTVSVFGPAGFKKRIRLTRVVEATVPFQVTEKPEPTLQPGQAKVKQEGVPGYRVRSYRITYDESGKVVHRELLGYDVYKPLNKVVLVGPPAPAPVASEPKPGGTEDTPQPAPPPSSQSGTVGAR